MRHGPTWLSDIFFHLADLGDLDPTNLQALCSLTDKLARMNPFGTITYIYICQNVGKHNIPYMEHILYGI